MLVRASVVIAAGEAGGCFCRAWERHTIVDYAVDTVEQSAYAVVIAAGEAGGCFCRVWERHPIVDHAVDTVEQSAYAVQVLLNFIGQYCSLGKHAQRTRG